MTTAQGIPDDPLAFIRKCIAEYRVFWTYHVNMKMRKRYIPRRAILESVASYEIIESYSEDKYLPSYLVYSRHEDRACHALFAVDVSAQNVRVVTAYYPAPEKWSEDLKRRRKS